MSSTEPSADRCIEWNDDATDELRDSEDDLAYVSHSPPCPHGAPASSATTVCVNVPQGRDDPGDRRIAYDSRDHTRWHLPSTATSAHAAGEAVTISARRHRHVLVLPRTVAHGLSSTQQIGSSSRTSDGATTAHLVRLPHPRHGQPSLFLVYAPCSSGDAGAIALQGPRLYEVQAQGPANDFGQTFLVGNEVLGSARQHDAPHGSSTPSLASSSQPVLPLALSHRVTCHDLLVATPVHAAFVVLQALVARRTTGSAEAEEGREAWDAWACAQPFVHARDLVAVTTLARQAPLLSDAKAAATSASPFALCVGGDDDDGTTHNVSDVDDGDAMRDSVDSGEDFVRAFQRDRRRSQATTPTSSWAMSSVPPRSHDERHGVRSGSSTHAAAGTRQYGWWPGWAAACEEDPLLAHLVAKTLTAPDVLSVLCEVKPIGIQSDTMATSAYVYRFAPAKAAAWLKTKIEQVRASPALTSLLQLPPEEVVERDMTGARVASPARVPLEVAMAVVGEYVPESFQRYLSDACGVTPQAAALVSSPSSSASSPLLSGGVGGVKRSRTALEADLHAQQHEQQKAAPKSASVRKLEKAGRPANTPTLMSMFAKKAPSASTDQTR